MPFVYNGILFVDLPKIVSQVQCGSFLHGKTPHVESFAFQTWNNHYPPMKLPVHSCFSDLHLLSRCNGFRNAPKLVFFSVRSDLTKFILCIHMCVDKIVQKLLCVFGVYVRAVTAPRLEASLIPTTKLKQPALHWVQVVSVTAGLTSDLE